MAHLVYTCLLSDLLGDECAGPLHHHHVHPISEGGSVDGETVVLCARHHSALHGLRRRLRGWRSCPHKPGTHRYPGAKELCERQLNRQAA